MNHCMFYIETYHVQGLALQYYSDNGSVVLECRFAERSTADGCHVIFRESSKKTVKSINMSKSSIEESTVYQYITLPVSGNYTVTAHDIVDGTIITNPSVVYHQVLEYILPPWPSPTDTITDISKYYILINMYSSILLGIILNNKTTISGLISDITSTPDTTLLMTSVYSVEPTIFSSKYILNKY